MMHANPLVIFRKEFDNTGILFDADSGQIFGLNASAVIVWEGLTQSMTLDEIIQELAQQMESIPDHVSQDVASLIAQLQEKGFLLEE